MIDYEYASGNQRNMKGIRILLAVPKFLLVKNDMLKISKVVV